jgi:hypothetical protein
MNPVADAPWRAYHIRRDDMAATRERLWVAIAEGRPPWIHVIVNSRSPAATGRE